ncbi:predicted protein [Arabidopsis lyrata subsp. lyrata]|uniref:Predicted protein n=1 Tax=Arabidopsis lyrata subsp. lyrata TaxID=81972 RepID=D7M5T0_ARALL|nr:predicted protein [Arabidopsis lyrata subsp. lyrata]
MVQRAVNGGVSRASLMETDLRIQVTGSGLEVLSLLKYMGLNLTDPLISKPI